jgi:hypothetical protein
MNNSRRTQTSKLAVLTAMIVVAVSAAAPVGVSASSADVPQASAATCRAGAVQSITHRNGISCRAAQRVYASAPASFGGIECRGRDKTKHWRGWTVRAIGRHKQGIAARWSKGSISFVSQDGGLC